MIYCYSEGVAPSRVQGRARQEDREGEEGMHKEAAEEGRIPVPPTDLGVEVSEDFSPVLFLLLIHRHCLLSLDSKSVMMRA